jgi:hypothetical protein
MLEGIGIAGEPLGGKPGSAIERAADESADLVVGDGRPPWASPPPGSRSRLRHRFGTSARQSGEHPAGVCASPS